MSGIGVHWYRGSDYTVLNRTHANHPTKFILATEACSGYEIIAPAVVLGSWSRGEDYSHDILQVGKKHLAMSLFITRGVISLKGYRVQSDDEAKQCSFYSLLNRR